MGPCGYSIWRWELPSNLLSQVYIKQICTPHPEPLLWGQERDSTHTSSLVHWGRGGCKGESQPYLETTEVLPILNLQQHWRQKEEAAHIPSGMWCPLLCLLKFCGWEGKQFVGLADIFLLCKCTTVGKLCFSLNLKFPKAKGYVSLLYCT